MGKNWQLHTWEELKVTIERKPKVQVFALFLVMYLAGSVGPDPWLIRGQGGWQCKGPELMVFSAVLTQVYLVSLYAPTQKPELDNICCLYQLYELQSYDSILYRINNRNQNDTQNHSTQRRLSEKIRNTVRRKRRDRRKPKDVLKHMERKPSRYLLSFT